MPASNAPAVRLPAVSSAYVSCTLGGKTYTWHFTGVISIEHNLSLNIETTESEETDLVNGARNLPDKVVLSVLESDAEHGPGWSAAMLKVMIDLKRHRYLCRVVTSMAVYDRMLLHDISATQDEKTQDGWQGTLSFVQNDSVSPAAAGGEGGGYTSAPKTDDNSSAATYTGTAASKKLTDAQLQQALQRAGVA